MADFVRFRLDDEMGSEVYIEAAESDLVALRGGQSEPDVIDAGRLRDRLSSVASAAEQVAESLRSRLKPDEGVVGVRVEGELVVYRQTRGRGHHQSHFRAAQLGPTVLSGWGRSVPVSPLRRAARSGH